MYVPMKIWQVLLEVMDLNNYFCPMCMYYAGILLNDMEEIESAHPNFLPSPPEVKIEAIQEQ